MDQKFSMGFKSGDDGGQDMRLSPETPILARYSLVPLAECEGALSCMKITLRRLKSGRSSNQVSRWFCAKSITSDEIKNLTKSMDGRMFDVISRQGAHVDK